MEDGSIPIRGQKREDKPTDRPRREVKRDEQSLPNWKQKIMKKKARKFTEEIWNGV
jgi:hypothetical protein